MSGAEWVQESVPERLDLKRRVLAEIDAACPADALIGSSTSGLLPSELQAGLAHPERLFVAHPYNPVYLLPAGRDRRRRGDDRGDHRPRPRRS